MKNETIFSAENSSTFDFMYTRRLNKAVTNDFVKLTMLQIYVALADPLSSIEGHNI